MSPKFSRIVFLHYEEAFLRSNKQCRSDLQEMLLQVVLEMQMFFCVPPWLVCPGGDSHCLPCCSIPVVISADGEDGHRATNLKEAIPAILNILSCPCICFRGLVLFQRWLLCYEERGCLSRKQSQPALLEKP